jgi:hypothetical protein
MKPGLVYSQVKVEIEDVKTAHRVPCVACGDLPAQRRLSLQYGSGRSAKTYVFCSTHAGRVLEWFEESARRARLYLMRQVAWVRTDFPYKAEIKATEAEKAARRKAKKEAAL